MQMFPRDVRARSLRATATLLTILTLASCGGGGGSSPAPPPPPPPPPPPNQAPTANAGADQAVVESEVVTLSAAASTDSDGTIASYVWSQTSGPAVTLANSDSVTASFDAPLTDTVLMFSFQVTVTDNDSASNSTSTNVTVDPNVPPVLSIRFPCEGCRAYSDAISVAGSVSPGNDNAFVAGRDGISSVTVDAGAGSITAIVQTDGEWIAQNVVLPSNSNAVSLSVTAVDLFNESDNVLVNLEYEPTFAGLFVLKDPNSVDRFFLVEGGGFRSRIFALNLATQVMTEVFDLPPDAPPADEAVAAVVDSDGSRIFVSEGSSIVAYDTTTGARTVVSDINIGSGPVPQFFFNIDIDADGGRLLLTDIFDHVLYTIDTTSGDRAIISDNTGTGMGPAFSSPSAIAVDSTNDIAYVAHNVASILAVDLATGDRTDLPASGIVTDIIRSLAYDTLQSRVIGTDDSGLVFAVNTVSGERSSLSPPGSSSLPLSGVARISFDALSSRYLANDFIRPSSGRGDGDYLLEIDAATGTRSVVFDNSTGAGLSINSSASIDIDTAGRRIILASEFDRSVTIIDLTTRQAQVISDQNVGSGNLFDIIFDVVFDTANNRALVVEPTPQSLLAVDLVTGNRSIISGSLVGGGPLFDAPTSLTLDAENNRAYVVDAGMLAVFSVDLASGQRAIVSDNLNSGTPLESPGRVALDSANNRLLITETGGGATLQNELLAIDLTSGDRTTISSHAIGFGPLLDGIRDVSLMPDGRALVGSHDEVYRVDLSTGDRVSVARQSFGNGERLLNSSFTYDADSNIIYAWGSNLEALLAIDAVTGDRVVVAK